MSTKPTKEQAKNIVVSLLSKAQKRFKQELVGENEEFLDRVIRQYRAKVARTSWKNAQKWCKWNNDGPVLMPDFTRIYYRKGNTEVFLQEYHPQVRLMKFKGTLAKRDDTDEDMASYDMEKTHHYSLALPYVVFLFKFVNGMFVEVRVAFCDRPLKRLDERPLRPYLSNIDSELRVCLGRDFDREQLEKDNLTQQSAYVLSHFWQTTYSDEWSTHFWANKKFFRENDPRMATMDAWQTASIENPLFVVEDVQWLRHHEENFGDMFVRMFEYDRGNVDLQEDLYRDLVEEFLTKVKKTLMENIDAIDGRILENATDQLADELIASL